MNEQTGKLPTWVTVTSVILCIAGAVLILLPLSGPQWIERISNKISPSRWTVLIGAWLLYSVLGNVIIDTILRFLTREFRLSEIGSSASRLTPIVVGFCEAWLYPVALITDNADFIGLWLAVKVAGSWVRWSGEDKRGDELDEARRRFNRFLIGNALSILGAFMFYCVLKVFALKA